MNETNQTKIGLAILRITLGVIILATWYENVQSGLYTADGLTGFFNWLFDAENGNGSSLLFFKSFLDTAVVPIAGIFGPFQLVAELVMGVALLLGGYTRLFGLAAMFFFFNLFLSYFGGNEWIWVYVLLIASSTAVTLGRAGRTWGIDKILIQKHGEPKFPLM